MSSEKALDERVAELESIIAQRDVSLVNLEKEKHSLTTRLKASAWEIENMSRAQRDLFRFQEKIAQQKTIYAQISQIGHRFNEKLEFKEIVTATERFVVDLMNYEISVLFLYDFAAGHMKCHSLTGYRDKQKIAAIQALILQVTHPLLQPLSGNEARITCKEGDVTPEFDQFRALFWLQEFSVYSLGKQGDLIKGFLLVGNSKENATIHQRVQVDEEFDAMFSNITSQIAGGMNTMSFLEAVQNETAQVKSLLDNMRQAVFSVTSDLKVVDPVSRFSTALFEENIVGKTVFQTLFKDLQEDSEAYSQIHNALATVYGEDDLQWDLVCHAFPHRVLSGSRVFHVSYCPIWEDGKLEKIMFVVDDVTELEKLELQLSKGRKEIEMIQYLSANSQEVNRDFFAHTQVLLRECRLQTLNLARQEDAFGHLMRALHTLKGNSRLLGLSGISRLVHEVETKVLALKGHLAPGTDDLLSSQIAIVGLLHSLEDIVQAYSQTAKKVLGVKSRFEAGMVSDLLEYLDSAENFLSGTKLAPIELDLLSALQNLRSLGAEDLLAALGPLEATLQGILVTPPALRRPAAYRELLVKICPLARSQFWASKLFSSEPMTEASLSEIFMEACHFQQAIEKSTSSSDQAPAKEAMALCCKKFNARSCLFLQYLAKFALNQMAEATPASWSKQCGSMVDDLWAYVGHLVQIQATFSGEEPGRPISALKTTMHEQGFSPAVVANILAAAQRHLAIQAAEPVATASAIRKQLMFGDLESPEMQQETVRVLPSVHRFLQAKQNRAISKFIIYLDLLQTVSIFDNEADDRRRSQMVRSVEVFEQNINVLARAIQRIPAASDAVTAEIKKSFSRLLDVSTKPVLVRFANMVNDVAANLGKKVAFEVSGDDVFLSRRQVEALQDLGVHIIRNAIDHGIEAPAERIQAGKAETGRIEIELRSEDEDHVQIEFRDDGRGLDPEILANIALRKGLVSATELTGFTIKDKIDLIFKPGFSSKVEATELSGRGLGMDIVRKLVAQIGGSIRIESRPGQGTTFCVRLDTTHSR